MDNSDNSSKEYIAYCLAMAYKAFEESRKNIESDPRIARTHMNTCIVWLRNATREIRDTEGDTGDGS